MIFETILSRFYVVSTFQFLKWSYFISIYFLSIICSLLLNKVLVKLLATVSPTEQAAKHKETLK